MPLATKVDAYGRPIYSQIDPNAPNARPDNPLQPVLFTAPLTQQNNQVDADRLTIGMQSDNKGKIDYGSFADRNDQIRNQGAVATQQKQQAYFDAMQKRLQSAQGAMGNIKYTPGMDTTDLRSKLVSKVASYAGTPYEWGGADPSGFDCSGLVQYAYKKLGISMPRTSAQDARLGVRTSINRLSPGDLVAHPGHIAVYAGNGYMWEAPHTGASVRLVRVRSDMYGIHLTLPGDR